MSKGSRKFLSCIAVFLITSMFITLFLFRTNVQASILGAKYYYLTLERDNLKDLEKKYKDSYIEKYLSEFSYACKVNAKLDGDLMKSNPVMKEIADYVSKIEMNINYNANNKDLKNSYLTALISTKYDGKTFMDIDIKSADNKALIAFPGLTEKTLGTEVSASDKSIKLSEAFMGDDKAFEEVLGLTREAYDKMIVRYLKDVIVKQIPDENVVLDSDVTFENIECNSITFNIDQKVVSDIYKAAAKELENDKEIRILIKSLTSVFMEIANEQTQEDITPPTTEEIDDEINILCNELNSQAEDMEEVQFAYTAYFKDNGDIISRQFDDKLGDTSAKLSIYEDASGTDIFNVNFKESEKTVFDLINASKLENGMNKGKFTIDVSGKSLLEAKYSYEKDAKVGNLNAFVGEIQGKIKLKQFNDSAIADYTDLDDIYFSVINKKKADDTLEGKVAFTSKFEGKRMGATIYTEVKQSDLANITKPEVDIDNSIKLTDYEGLEEIGTEITENLQKKVLELFSFPNGLDNKDF